MLIELKTLMRKKDQLPPSNAASYERDVENFHPDYHYSNIEGFFDENTSASSHPEVKLVQRLDNLYKSIVSNERFQEFFKFRANYSNY